MQNQVEDNIVSKEAAYLESTPSGNIITGFDNYMKGTTGAAAQRRKAGPADQNRVFSKSSISYRPNNGVCFSDSPWSVALFSLCFGLYTDGRGLFRIQRPGRPLHRTLPRPCRQPFEITGHRHQRLAVRIIAKRRRLLQ